MVDMPEKKTFMNTILSNHWHHCLIALVMIALHIYTLETTELLRFSRTAILIKKEWWRGISAHFIHLNLNHLLLNLGGLLAIMLTFFEEARPKRDLMMIIVSCMIISLVLLFFVPNIAWYVGFSGVLHGYLAYFLILSFKEQPLLSLLVLGVLLCKVIWEMTPNADLSATEKLINGVVNQFIDNIATV